ncbi:MAG: Ig-like domain-containing protein, partial [Verrucomicrobia bacterium]|nr:Ig-like domain-containing protein [Verrucomicrobiota bacterium]
IAQTNLTVTAATNTKFYDGTTNAAAHPTITVGSIQPGDTAPVWTETYANKNAGTAKTLTPTALTVADGNGGLNYSYTYTPVTTGVIAQTNLTVTAATNTKFYDGTTNAAAHPTITVGSIQPGDTEPVWTETYTNQNAGTGKTLTPAELAVADGNGGANYNYTYAPDFSGVITALSTSTLLSSDSNPSGLATNVTFTATVSGVPPAADLPTGDVIFAANGTPFATNGLISGSITASTASLPAGTNTVTAQYVGDGNFEASLSSTLAQVVTNSVIYSQTNLVLSLVNNRNGTFTLNLRGTPGAQYYLAASGNVKAHMADWIPVAGSTNITADSEGKWSCLVSNPAPAYYRSIAVKPAP